MPRRSAVIVALLGLSLLPARLHGQIPATLSFDHVTIFALTDTGPTCTFPNGNQVQPNVSSGVVAFTITANCQNSIFSGPVTGTVSFTYPTGNLTGTFGPIDAAGDAGFLLTSPSTAEFSATVTSNLGSSNIGVDLAPGYLTPVCLGDGSETCEIPYLSTAAPFGNGILQAGHLERITFIDNLGEYLFEYDIRIYFTATVPEGIDHLEVVQSVQDAANSVQLIAGKPTEVRVFVQMHETVPGMTCLLQGFGNGGELSQPQPPLKATFTGATSFDRSQTNQSINFRLPDDWITAGTVTLKAQISVPAGVQVTSFQSTKIANAVFERGRLDFHVGFIPFCYEVSGAPRICPDQNGRLLASYDKQLRQTYPIAPENVTYQQLNVPTLVWTTAIQGLDDGGFFAALQKFFDSSFGQNLDQLIGWLPRIPGSNLVGEADVRWAGYFGRGRVVLAEEDLSRIDDSVNVAYNSTTVAHEIAHNLGRRHTNNKPSSVRKAGCGDLDSGTDWPYPTADIQQPGWDFETMEVAPPDNGDVMSYCGNFGVPSWISPWTYSHLLTGQLLPSSVSHPAARGAMNAPGLSASSAAAPSEQIIISGVARKDGTAARLDPAYRVPLDGTAPPSLDSGSHCLHFSGPSGALGDYCFQLAFEDYESQQPLDRQFFSLKAPLPPGATSIALMAGTQELTSLTATSLPPLVNITSPHTGDVWTGGMRTIAWSASDPDGNPLVYAVLYSSDGGTSWLPIALDIQNAQFTFDPAQIDGGKNVLFRVLASDGMNSTTVDVGPIEVAQMPKISPAVATLDFGSLPVGRSAQQTLSLSNNGTGPITISSVAINSPDFHLVAGYAPLVIPAGSSRTVAVQWSVASTGPDSATLTLTSSDPVNPSISVLLKGTGTNQASPQVAVGVTGLDFGSVNVGRTNDLTFSLNNTGNATLTVQSLSSSSALFTVVTPAIPFPVESGQSASVTVRFTPHAGADATGLLTMISNDPSQGTITLTLHGIGVGTAGGAAPAINASGIVNVASNLPKVSRGALVSIYGTNLATTTALASSLPLPLTLGGASVTVDGIPAPMLYASAIQLDIQIPYEVALGADVPVVVTAGGASSLAATVTVADYAVGVFTYARTSSAIDPVVVHANGALVTPAAPATEGETLVVYGDGVGKLNHPPATGAAAISSPPSTALDTPAITVGGLPVVVSFAGLTPGDLGLVQFNIQLPSSIPSGNLPLVIVFPGDSSPPVNLAVQGTGVAGCTFLLNPTFLNHPAASSAATLHVTASASTCTWTATSNVPWARVTSTTAGNAVNGVGSGAGNGVVAYQVDPNSGPARTGTMTIAGLTFTIDQDAGSAGGTASLSVSPASLNFGNVPVGQSSNLTVTITNKGNATLNVTALGVDAPAFAVLSPSAPFNVAAGASATVTVRFTAVAGPQTGTLAIASSDPANPTVTVPLTGTGTTGSGGGTAGLSGTSNSSTAPVNLTTEGAADWMHWGDANVETKAGSATKTQNLILNFATVPPSGGPATGTYVSDPRLLSWSDGYPFASSGPNGDTNAESITGAGNGFTFTVPADTSPRTLIVHVGGLQCSGTFTAHLSDSSSADFSDTTPATAAYFDRNYTLVYAAASAAQTLTITWTMKTDLGSAQLTIAAAALSLGGTIGPGGSSGSPSISEIPAALNFSSVPAGQSKQLSLTLSNKGSSTLNVSSVTAGGVFRVLSPAAPFTVVPGGSTAVFLQFSPIATGGQAGTLNIVSNDPVQPNLAVPIWGTGYNPANVLISDSFNRANATECSLGAADLKFGGSGVYYYLPDWPGSGGPIGAGIVSGALENNGLDFGGVQLTTSSDACGSARGATLPQDLDIIVDLYVPGSSGEITDAGPYFRSRSAAPGDGLFGGTSSGYWVELFGTGEVWVDQLNPFKPIAKTAVPASFNPNVVHTLETVVQGANLQVTLDGNPQTFTQNGAAVTTVEVSPASNNGAVGISFGSERNRGQAGGQSAGNLVISSIGGGSSPTPQISVSPANLSFGNVTVGQSSTLTLTITNEGGATLNVTSLSIAGPFAIVSPGTPFTVAAGASATVTISFTAVAGPQSATLTIASNDPANPSVSVAVTGNGAALGVSAGLVGYWPFEGNGQDASGNGYDLTLEGGATFGPGISGQALSLPGNSSSYAVRSADDTTFDFGADDFSIQVWFQTASLDKQQTIIEKFTGASGPGWTLTAPGGGEVQFYSSPIGGLNATGLTAGSWNQIVVTRQAATLSIYINGVVAGTLDYGSTAIIASTNPLLVGKRNAGDGRDFSVNGSIDQAAIWNRALSPTEVSGLFTGGGVISQ